MKPRIIGIAGGTASGKSTLANRLAGRLGERCVHLLHDRYYRPLNHVQRVAIHEVNFDHPASLETERLIRDLERLLQGHTTSVPRYNFSIHDREVEEDKVEPKPIILVEGILIFSDAQLRSCFDRRYYVHAPDEVRFIRRLRRDIAERGRTEPEVVAQYHRTVQPMHEEYVAPSKEYADAVLDGTSEPDVLVDRLLFDLQQAGWV